MMLIYLADDVEDFQHEHFRLDKVAMIAHKIILLIELFANERISEKSKNLIRDNL